MIAVLVIGAATNGIQACEDFLRFAEPAACAIVILPGDSHTPDLLAATLCNRYPGFQTLTARAGEAVAAGAIYVLNPSVPLRLEGNYFKPITSSGNTGKRISSLQKAANFQPLQGMPLPDGMVQESFYESLSPILILKEITSTIGSVTDFEIEAVNRAAQALFDHTAQALSHQRLSQIHPEPTAALVHSHLAYTALHRKSQKFEYAINSAEGRETWYEVTAVKIDGGVAATYNDITATLKAQDRLRHNYNQLVTARRELRELNALLEATVEQRTNELAKSEERLRLVANATNDAIYDWELSDGQRWWSEGMAKQFGHSLPEQSAHGNFWQQHLHPDDKARVVEALQQAIHAQQEWKMEYRFQRADGSYAYVLDRAAIIRDVNSISYRILGSMLDITQVQEARMAAQKREAEYYDLANSMPNIVWATDSNSRIRYFNFRWQLLTGQQLTRPVPLEALRDCFHPDDFEALLQAWNEARAAHRPFDAEVRIRNVHTGNYQWFRALAEPTYESNPALTRWNGVFMDIHESKTFANLLEQRVAERTQELETVNTELERSNSELLQFASVTSHDLKEPLRKIQIFGKMLQQKASQAGNELFVDPTRRIVESSERMTVLIDDLLAFSRLNAPHTEEPTPLNEVLAMIVSDLEVTIAEKNATIHYPDMPVVRAVPGQMRQLFQNLISNGLKFTPKGLAPVIRIGATRISEKSFDAPPQPDGPYVRITVQDNGIGFDQQYLEKIFTLFQRLHARSDYEGTGIGLAIVKKIVERHNGLITAYSAVGEGATFVIVLPMIIDN